MEILRKLENQGELPVFCQQSFLESRSNNYGWFFEDDKILPFIIDERLIFKRLIFTNCIYSKREYNQEEEKKFLNNVILLAGSLKVDFISKPQANVFFKVLPNDNVIGAEWGSYQKKIDLSEKELLESLPSKTRNMVRRGKREGLIIEKGTVSELHMLLSKTFSRQKQDLLVPKIEYLQKLKKNLGKNFLILKCTNNARIEAIVGVPLDNNVGYYLYGGSISKPSPGAMNLLQFETMLHLRNVNVKIYDFVGARISPSKASKFYRIQKFKESFNPKLEKGFVFKVVFKPVKYKLFNFLAVVAYRLKRGKYEGDPIDQILKENRNVE